MLTPEQNNQAASPAKSNRRRQYIVHPKVQWKHAIILGAAVFLFCVILSCGLFASLYEEARQRVINPAGYKGSVVTLIVTAAITYSALTAGMIGFWMIVSTHRMCGPVYVLEQAFQELAKGSIPRLRPLRTKDEFKDVFETFAKAVGRVREDKENQLAKVSQALSAARANRYVGEHECREALESLAAQLQQLRSELALGLGQDAPAEKPARSPRVPVGAA
jgi:hypothetical protein